MKAKLSDTQQMLLIEANKYTSQNCPIKYDILKSLCNVKSFDTTFNKLFLLGYFERVQTNDYSNQFILTNKQ